MKITYYDLSLLVLFVVSVSVFLYTRRKNLQREGLLYLYRTKLGMKLIDYVGRKYKKTLHVLSYISIATGYVLMVGAFWLVLRILWIYIAYPAFVRQIKVPPIMPLVPYIDKLVPGLPSFYFTYWIVILAIIAITHEFAHGIFMRRYNIGIKSTGFGFFPFFLPVFLAAFVEQDEKSMVKKSKFEQMAVLSAGTFANVLTAILFFVIMFLFFSYAFTPAGVIFDTYSYSAVDLVSITMINGVALVNPTSENIVSSINQTGPNEIIANGVKYAGVRGFSEDKTQVALYDDTPAINAELTGAITEINGVKIKDGKELSNELSKYSPGDEITIKTKTEEENFEYQIILGENPEDPTSPMLGIGFYDNQRKGILGEVYNALASFKDSNTYYEPKHDGWSWFIYYLFWWMVLISISVALINMLPVGIFDGGRFFYLTVLGITGSKKKAMKSFKFTTYFFLFVLLLLLVFWGLSFIL